MKGNYGEYFENKVETGPKSDWSEALCQPIIQNVRYEDVTNGGLFSHRRVWHVEGGNDKLQLSFSYGKSGTVEVLDHLSEFESMLKPEIKKHLQETGGEWRMLEGFVLSDSAENRLDLTPLLEERDDESEAEPYGHPQRPLRAVSVVFRASNDVSDEESFLGLYNPGRKAVLVSNITTPRGIITLLHELGHARPEDEEPDALRTEKNNTGARYLNYVRTLNRNLLTDEERNNPDIHKHIAGFILEEERDAWASVLWKLKPFIRSGALDKDAVLSVIHSRTLKGYSEALEKLVSPPFIEGVYRNMVSKLNTLLSPKMTHSKGSTEANL